MSDTEDRFQFMGSSKMLIDTEQRLTAGMVGEAVEILLTYMQPDEELPEVLDYLAYGADPSAEIPREGRLQLMPGFAEYRIEFKDGKVIAHPWRTWGQVECRNAPGLVQF